MSVSFKSALFLQTASVMKCVAQLLKVNNIVSVYFHKML